MLSLRAPNRPVMNHPSPFLPHLPADRLAQRYKAAKGNELDSGKMLSPESSSALAANAFGFFLDAPARLPPLPGTEDMGWPSQSVLPEVCMRFPWAGGLHPWLDVLIETSTHIIGIESKRFEPYRSLRQGTFSNAFQRDVWGMNMAGFQSVRDSIAGPATALTGGIGTKSSAAAAFDGIDAAQLVKHALGLHTQAGRHSPPKKAVLCYLYADPAKWSDGRAISPDRRALHARAVDNFAVAVKGCDVQFMALTYSTLLPQQGAVESTPRGRSAAQPRAHLADRAPGPGFQDHRRLPP